MKIMTIIGTRPELIRLSEVIKKIDTYFEHVFVHTGQNFDVNLRDKFFVDLELRQPDYQLNLKEKFIGFEFIGHTIIKVANILTKEKPDKVLVLGDVNSALVAYVAKQLNIPVYHMEAGNRCFEDVVPEEVNRRIIDSCSEFLLAYTQRSKENLLLEGYKLNKIIVTGNPITEVIYKNNNLSKNQQDKILENYKINKKEYFVSTVHRTENVTNENNLRQIVVAINEASKIHPIILSMHPKFVSMVNKFGLKFSKDIIQCEPFGLKDFLFLISNAKAVLTDSGTLPEECCILKTPVVLMRNSTERPELLENNSMVLSGINSDLILKSLNLACELSIGEIPVDYVDINVSDKIVKILCK